MRTLNIKSILLTLVMILAAGSVKAYIVEYETPLSSDINDLISGLNAWGSYPYSVCQSIYSPAELDCGAGQISSISYRRTSSSDFVPNLKIYMGYKNSNMFSNTSDFCSINSLELVYSGLPTLGSSDSYPWDKIILDKQFEYDGLRNLVVVVVTQGLQYTNGDIGYDCASKQNGQLRKYSYSSESSNVDTGNYTNYDVLPIIRVGIERETHVVNGISYYCFGSAAIVTNLGSCKGDVSIPNSIKLENNQEYNVISIAKGAFTNNTNIKNINLPSSINTLPSNLFDGCTNLTSLTFTTTDPVTLSSASSLPSSAAIYVPSGSVETYKAATYWSDHADQIVAEGTKTEYDLTGANAVTEESGRSVLERIIGETHLPEVISLKVEGTINSYDLMVMRNKMVSLKNLDLSKATIKANSYEYYTGYCSQDNTLRYWSLNDNLYSVKLPTSLTKIDDNAFSNLTHITEIEIPANVTSIGSYAFAKMTSLKTATFANNSQCATIGSYAFQSCSALAGISIPAKMTTIDKNAFRYCSSLKNLVLEDSEESLILGTADSYNYCCIRDNSNNIVNSYYSETSFGNCPIQTLYLGRSLKCGYYYNNKNNFNEYSNYKLCPGNTNLTSVEFGPYATSIDDGMFAGCSSLKELKGLENVTSIGTAAFYGCSSLESFNVLPAITTFGEYTFARCTGIETFTFDDNCQITAIPNYFLYGASKLDKIALPKSTLTIGNYAFYGCELMKECKIASNITSIGDYAFNQCNNLNSVYAYTSDPQQIDQNTFSTYHTATLYVPLPSRTTYYYNTQWSQFLNLVGFDYSTDQVGFNGDFQLYPETDGIYGGKPRADIFAHGSLWIHGDRIQPFGDIHLRAEGGYYGSLIASGNLTADRIYFDINVEKDKWHFFCFPFDIPLANITKDGNYKWAEYDGSVRAANGTTGWKTLPSGTKTLKKGHGYIFRTDYTGDLSLRVENPTFDAVNEQTTLTSYTSTSDANADWNMVGNPYPCYYPINKLEYGAPIIVWNGASYDAYRPGDDDYILHPFEAFFVQKPEAVGYVGFYHESRQTYQSSHPSASQAKISGFQYVDPFEATATASTETARQLINLSLCLGDNCDKTRVVFNAAKAESYERDCDAAKFVTTDTAPQLYSIGSDDTKYAINERPVSNGKVALGFYAPEDGMYTINATRMDVAARIYDAQTAKTYDLADGEFAFNASKGIDNGRFTLILDDTTTGVNAIENGESSVENCYDLGGRKVNNAQNGVYIENGKKVIKK